jgi:hypothetical protein
MPDLSHQIVLRLWLLPVFFLRQDIFAQDSIDLGLIALALFFEPQQNVGIHAHVQPFFGRFSAHATTLNHGLCPLGWRAVGYR